VKFVVFCLVCEL